MRGIMALPGPSRADARNYGPAWPFACRCAELWPCLALRVPMRGIMALPGLFRLILTLCSVRTLFNLSLMPSRGISLTLRFISLI